MQNVDTAYVFTVVLPYIKIGDVGFKEFPHLKKFYARCGVLWSRGYFISTVGTISADTVIQYIQEQKTNGH